MQRSGKRTRHTCVGVLILVFLSLLLGTNVACAEWIEMARFPVYWGTAPNVIRHSQTANFTCSHEWRIAWNYTPLSIVNPEYVYFNILIYRTNETNYIMEMNQQGNITTDGTMYINNQTGEFNLKFLVYNVLDSAAVVEQDIELDMNGDGRVDMKDIGYVARRFMISTSDPLWDPDADLNSDGIINGIDIGTTALHFMEHYP